MNKDIELNKEQIAEVIMKLIGNVNPIGETYEDSRRYKNLELMGEVFRRIFDELSDVVCFHKDSVMGSCISAAEESKKIIYDTVIDYMMDYEMENIKKTIKLWEE